VLFTWVNSGVQQWEQYRLNISTPTDLFLRLYTNNRGNPQVTDTGADYTECTLAGYAAVDLAPGNWSLVTVNGVCTATYPAVMFSFGAYAGGVTIYGAMLTNGAGNLWMASPLDAVFPVPPGGGSLTLNLTDLSYQC
jgi:hypothetical protein